MRDTNEVRRWRALVVTSSLAIGVDEQGQWLQFVPRTERLIPATAENMLFYLPLLDMEYTEFDSQTGRVMMDDEELRTGARDLVQKVLSLALQQRSTSYIERALSWLEHVSPNDDARNALDEFARSKRGTQILRHAAFSILRRRSI
ncbi:hypothetical protein [Sorangium sp. So ce887]|uniref:hypothetical protein n=1 Tax=Sorangium sp. So ce887 TaxID=3133324 RepID=UPI003F632FEE